MTAPSRSQWPAPWLRPQTWSSWRAGPAPPARSAQAAVWAQMRAQVPPAEPHAARFRLGPPRPHQQQSCTAPPSLALPCTALPRGRPLAAAAARPHLVHLLLNLDHPRLGGALEHLPLLVAHVLHLGHHALGVGPAGGGLRQLLLVLQQVSPPAAGAHGGGCGAPGRRWPPQAITSGLPHLFFDAIAAAAGRCAEAGWGCRRPRLPRERTGMLQSFSHTARAADRGKACPSLVPPCRGPPLETGGKALHFLAQEFCANLPPCPSLLGSRAWPWFLTRVVERA